MSRSKKENADLSALLATVPRELMQQAQKLVVRECDEVTKGRYVAYVDEGSQSWDVSLTRDETGVVTDVSCECHQGRNLCKHLVGLILFLDNANEKKAGKARGRKKEENPVDILLEQVPEDALKAWLKEVFRKNKDLEVAFKKHFTDNPKTYGVSDIQPITQEAVKAVLGRKKNADPTEMKRLTELLEQMYAPILAQYKANPADESQFLLLHEIVTTLIDLAYSIRTTSSRLRKYLEQMLKSTLPDVFEVTLEASWRETVGYFIKYLDATYLNLPYSYHLKDIWALADTAKKALFLDILVEHYRNREAANKTHYNEVITFVFQCLQEQDELKKHIHLFRPSYYQPLFNEMLIKELIKLEKYEDAVSYCKQIINENKKDKYSYPFVKLLYQVYRNTNNTEGCKLTGQTILYEELDINLYRELMALMTPDEAMLLTKTAIKKSAARMKENLTASIFHFTLLAQERLYAKMIDLITTVNMKVTAQFFDELYNFDKGLFIKKVLERNPWLWAFDNQYAIDEDEGLALVYDKLKKMLGEELFKNLVYAASKQYSARYPTGTSLYFMKRGKEDFGG